MTSTLTRSICFLAPFLLGTLLCSHVHFEPRNDLALLVTPFHWVLVWGISFEFECVYALKPGKMVENLRLLRDPFKARTRLDFR